jgi:hypothetical protein
MERRTLKSFARYDGNGRLVAGSNILARKMPKVGNWVEGPAYLCCNPSENVVTGEWDLINTYNQPINGQIIFPDHVNGVASLDPNLVGVNDGITGVQLYIAITDNTGNVNSALSNLPGESGTITLTQGSDSVTYSFTPDSFMLWGPFTVAFDWIFGVSIVGSLNVVSPSTGNFTTTDPITISLVIT